MHLGARRVMARRCSYGGVYGWRECVCAGGLGCSACGVVSEMQVMLERTVRAGGHSGVASIDEGDIETGERCPFFISAQHQLDDMLNELVLSGLSLGQYH